MFRLRRGAGRSSVDAVGRVAAVLSEGDAVAFTGAGISAGSGFPTFHGSDGVWRRFDPERFGSIRGLFEEAMARPDRVGDFLAHLRRGFAHARPNPGHRAIAALDRHGLVRTVITQNVDSLHQDAGASSVIELHGSFRRNVCVSCGAVEHITREQLLRDFDHIIRGLRSAFIPSLLSLFPKCAVCGGPMRPDFVAFGEPIRNHAPAARAASACRSMLVVGTSGVVFPAGELPQRARRAGAPIILITDGPSSVRADITLLGDASKLLPAIAERVQAGSGAPREGTG